MQMYGDMYDDVLMYNGATKTNRNLEIKQCCARQMHCWGFNVFEIRMLKLHCLMP